MRTSKCYNDFFTSNEMFVMSLSFYLPLFMALLPKPLSFLSLQSEQRTFSLVTLSGDLMHKLYLSVLAKHD